jgi:hypothetical protein
VAAAAAAELGITQDVFTSCLETVWVSDSFTIQRNENPRQALSLETFGHSNNTGN